jgi:hypothetical protein
MPSLIEQLSSPSPLTVSEQYDEKFARAITCLNVVGGCEEVLRVGGAVLVHSRGGEIQKGMHKITFVYLFYFYYIRFISLYFCLHLIISCVNFICEDEC